MGDWPIYSTVGGFSGGWAVCRIDGITGQSVDGFGDLPARPLMDLARYRMIDSVSERPVGL